MARLLARLRGEAWVRRNNFRCSATYFPLSPTSRFMLQSARFLRGWRHG